jgi:Flp pilus assembly protein TadG
MGIRRFLVNRDGNMAMVLAVCLVPLLVGIGAAVDYARLADARELMQHSLDATVLALSSEAPKLTADQLNIRATQVFNTNFPSGRADGVKVSATYTQGNGAVIAGTATGTVSMTFLNIVGISSETLMVQSTSAWSSKRLRVALALDNTGSMADNGKMTALKTATKDLLKKLKASSTTNGDVFVSIVPFNKDVNIGVKLSQYVSWTKKGRKCTWVAGSWWTPAHYNCVDDWLWPQTKAHSYWAGCVSDRDKNMDIAVDSPIGESTYYPAEDYSTCGPQLTPMTNNWSTLDTAVDAMTPAGGTNQTIGLVWAWQSLKSTSPLNAPAKLSGYDYQDVIILLSDGENTMNRFDGDGSSHSAAVDDRMSKVCTAAKADGVIIYTVLVISGTESVLRDCASSADNYFNASTADQIITSFGAIGDKLSALRIAR